MSNYMNLRDFLPRARRRVKPNRVAIIRLYGPINGGERSADWIELVRRVRESKKVPAVVLDIDSPGGSAAASDNMYVALARLAAKKPLVAAIRGAGASGSYLAAVAAKKIVASPTSIVGSIGVINVAPRLPRLLDRLGVGVSEHTAGSLKGMGAPWREESDPEAQKEQQLVDEIYDAFVDRVATARNMSPERVRELATGEVWLGSKAVELGLVDQVGDIEDAVEIAAQLAGVPAKATPVRLPRPFFSRIAERFATRMAQTVADEMEARLSSRIRL